MSYPVKNTIETQNVPNWAVYKYTSVLCHFCSKLPFCTKSGNRCKIVRLSRKYIFCQTNETGYN